jgi:hypothetical protein
MYFKPEHILKARIQQGSLSSRKAFEFLEQLLLWMDEIERVYGGIL